MNYIFSTRKQVNKYYFFNFYICNCIEYQTKFNVVFIVKRVSCEYRLYYTKFSEYYHSREI